MEWPYRLPLLFPRHFSSMHSLAASLPAQWGPALTALQLMDLSSNRLTYTLPAAWSALASLSRLDLGSNNFMSTIPASWQIGMVSLTRLVLTGNSAM